MNQYISRLNASLALAIVIAIAGCADTKKNSDTLAQDTSLNRDIQLANADTSAQPALTDVPVGTEPGTVTPGTVRPGTVTPAPSRTTAGAPRTTTSSRAPSVVRRPTPAPARTPTATNTPTTTSSGNTVTRSPAGSERAVGMIAAGSTVNLRSGSRICTNTNRVGDRFNATVSEAVVGSNGAMIPAGATAAVEVTTLKRSENAKDGITMGLRVISVSFGGRTYPISASTSYAQVDKVRNQPKSKDMQKVIGGAAIGAIAGQILGGSTKATVIGAAAGGAAGAATAAATSNVEGCLPSGGRITATLNSATQVQS